MIPKYTRSMMFVFAIILGTAVSAEPLHDAAKQGDTAEVERLIQAGIELEALDDDGLTPLIVAALAGQQGTTKLLIDNGVDPGGRDGKGYTALHAAAHAGHYDIVVLLLEHDIDVNDQANPVKLSPLHAAAERDHRRIAAVLIERGAAVNVRERNGWTPAMRATFKSHAEMVALLRDHGATCSGAAGNDFLEYCMTSGE